MSENFDGQAINQLVPDSMKRAFERCPDFLMDSDEKTLSKELKLMPVDHVLRQSLWREYSIITKRGYGKIQLEDIIRGVCCVKSFRTRLKSDSWVAWVLKPLREFEIESEALLTFGMGRLWELVSMDITDHSGRVDAKLGALLLKTVKEIKDTVKGQAVQRVQQHITGEVTHKPVAQLDERQVNERIKLAEAKIKKSPLDLEAISNSLDEEDIINDKELPRTTRKESVCGTSGAQS